VLLLQQLIFRGRGGTGLKKKKKKKKKRKKKKKKKKKKDKTAATMGCRSCEKPKMNYRKGLWSPEEDQRLRDYILKHGLGCWSAVPAKAGELLFFFLLSSSLLPCTLLHEHDKLMHEEKACW
jgi:hypothetical protein